MPAYQGEGLVKEGADDLTGGNAAAGVGGFLWPDWIGQIGTQDRRQILQQRRRGKAGQCARSRTTRSGGIRSLQEVGHYVPREGRRTKKPASPRTCRGLDGLTCTTDRPYTACRQGAAGRRGAYKCASSAVSSSRGLGVRDWGSCSPPAQVGHRGRALCAGFCVTRLVPSHPPCRQRLHHHCPLGKRRRARFLPHCAHQPKPVATGGKFFSGFDVFMFNPLFRSLAQ